MVRETPSRFTLRRAVEEFGSEAHLARALGVTREQLQAWLKGSEEAPPEIYTAVFDLLSERWRKDP